MLSIVVSSYLFDEYRDIQEGALTKIRAAVVCEKALSKFAKNILADTFEALLAAIYLDSGEHFNIVTPYLLPFVKEELAYIEENSVFVDYKTTLQQIVQQVEGEKLEYVLVSESGPDHNKLFEVEARLNSNVIGRGKAHAKREAEQLAAKEALVLFGEQA